MSPFATPPRSTPTVPSKPGRGIANGYFDLPRIMDRLKMACTGNSACSGKQRKRWEQSDHPPY